MPRVPPDQMQVGQRYTSIWTARPHGPRGTRPFLGLRPGDGWAIFNAGFGARSITNPAAYNFYLEGNANIPPEHIQVPGGAAPAAGPAPIPRATLAQALAVPPSAVPYNVGADNTNAVTYDEFVDGENVYQLNNAHVFKAGPLRTVWTGNAQQGIQSRFINPLTGVPPEQGKVRRGVARIRRNANANGGAGPAGGAGGAGLRRRKSRRARRTRRSRRTMVRR